MLLKTAVKINYIVTITILLYRNQERLLTTLKILVKTKNLSEFTTEVFLQKLKRLNINLVLLSDIFKTSQ